MSETTRFKYYRTFPFCVSDVEPSGLPYVVLTLEEAMAWFWNFEALELTPSGLVSADYIDEDFPDLNETIQTEYDLALSLPEVGSNGASSWFVYGPMAQGNTSDPLAYESFTPVQRVCRSISDLSATYSDGGTGGAGSGDHREQASFSLQLRFISGEYRLYYSFRFYVKQESTDPASVIRAEAWIQSSNWTTSGLFERSSGTFSFMGKTFDFKAYTLPDSSSGPPTVSFLYDITGAAITPSGETFFTYPPP